MKKITKEEYDGLIFIPKGARISEAVQKCLLLNINEGLVMSPEEWKLRTTPKQYFYQRQDSFNGMVFTARKMADGNWAIFRIS